MSGAVKAGDVIVFPSGRTEIVEAVNWGKGDPQFHNKIITIDRKGRQHAYKISDLPQKTLNSAWYMPPKKTKKRS